MEEDMADFDEWPHHVILRKTNFFRGSNGFPCSVSHHIVFRISIAGTWSSEFLTWVCDQWSFSPIPSLQKMAVKQTSSRTPSCSASNVFQVTNGCHWSPYGPPHRRLQGHGDWKDRFSQLFFFPTWTIKTWASKGTWFLKHLKTQVAILKWVRLLGETVWALLSQNKWLMVTFLVCKVRDTCMIHWYTFYVLWRRLWDCFMVCQTFHWMIL